MQKKKNGGQKKKKKKTIDCLDKRKNLGKVKTRK